MDAENEFLPEENSPVENTEVEEWPEPENHPTTANEFRKNLEEDAPAKTEEYTLLDELPKTSRLPDYEPPPSFHDSPESKYLDYTPMNLPPMGEPEPPQSPPPVTNAPRRPPKPGQQPVASQTNPTPYVPETDLESDWEMPDETVRVSRGDFTRFASNERIMIDSTSRVANKDTATRRRRRQVYWQPAPLSYLVPAGAILGIGSLYILFIFIWNANTFRYILIDWWDNLKEDAPMMSEALDFPKWAGGEANGQTGWIIFLLVILIFQTTVAMGLMTGNKQAVYWGRAIAIAWMVVAIIPLTLGKYSIDTSYNIVTILGGILVLALTFSSKVRSWLNNVQPKAG